MLIEDGAQLGKWGKLVTCRIKGPEGWVLRINGPSSLSSFQASGRRASGEGPSLVLLPPPSAACILPQPECGLDCGLLCSPDSWGGGMLHFWLLAPSSPQSSCWQSIHSIFLGGTPPPIRLPLNSPPTHTHTAQNYPERVPLPEMSEPKAWGS